MSNEPFQPRWLFFMLAMGLVVLFMSLLSWAVGVQEADAQKEAETSGAGEFEWPQIGLREVISDGLSNPVQVTHAGDGSQRLFIVEKGGRIRIYKDGTLLEQPFLDIRHLVSGFSEQGLLGLAFSPDYVNNGHFFVNYTDILGDTQIVRYHVSDDPDVAEPENAKIILRVEQDSSNHNGGQIEFGPDGYFYIGMGDGGGANDRRNRAQDPNQLLGKMLRIDVETADPLTYTIPLDNPFVNDPNTLDEIWALGLRNPWRFSFDKQTGDLYIGDVGQYMWEEINVQSAKSHGGENYGWRCYEGTHVNQAITSDCEVENHTPPIYEYSHVQDLDHHCSVTGGMVYRGATYARMNGIYFYADYCSGYIWGLQYTGSEWQNRHLYHLEENISTFGQDEAGHLYMATLDTDKVYQIVDLDKQIYFPVVRNQ